MKLKPQCLVEVGLVRDRIVIYKEKTRWDELLEKSRQKAKELGISESDVEKAISEIRYGS